MFEVHRIADELSPHGIEVVKHWKILSRRKVVQDALPSSTEGALQFISLPQAALADSLKNGVTRWRIHSGDVEVDELFYEARKVEPFYGTTWRLPNG
jgi:hypothetical protein